MREATRLDPDNLDAFSVAQKLLIRDGRFDEARANIAARRARCRTGGWLSPPMPASGEASGTVIW